MKTHEFWHDTETGEYWAVELLDGVVAACCGPLDWSEMEEEFLNSFDYATEPAAWVEANRERFALHSPVTLP